MRRNEYLIQLHYTLDHSKGTELESYEQVKKACTDFANHYQCFIACIDHTSKKHAHIVIKFANENRLESKYLCKYFKTTDPNIEWPKISFTHAVQYLTHKNQPNKEQYDYNDISTNNSEMLFELYNADLPKIDFVDKTAHKERVANITEKYLTLIFANCFDSFSSMYRQALNNDELEPLLERAYFFKSIFSDYSQQKNLSSIRDALESSENALINQRKENEKLFECIKNISEFLATNYPSVYFQLSNEWRKLNISECANYE